MSRKVAAATFFVGSFAGKGIRFSLNTILILNDYKDAVRRSAEGDGSPVASPPKAEVESGATMTAKPSARLRRGEILLPHTKEMIYTDS